ncbi:MAG: hypothetical protein JWR60_2846, partial [Polaromonas sp.]|nr:hypothetical protein [Polaromonas sp.]
TVHCSDHPNRDRALMYGIVKELIFLLEHGRVAAAAPDSQAAAQAH